MFSVCGLVVVITQLVGSSTTIQAKNPGKFMYKQWFNLNDLDILMNVLVAREFIMPMIALLIISRLADRLYSTYFVCGDHVINSLFVVFRRFWAKTR